MGHAHEWKGKLGLLFLEEREFGPWGPWKMVLASLLVKVSIASSLHSRYASIHLQSISLITFHDFAFPLPISDSTSLPPQRRRRLRRRRFHRSPSLPTLLRSVYRFCYPARDLANAAPRTNREPWNGCETPWCEEIKVVWHFAGVLTTFNCYQLLIIIVSVKNNLTLWRKGVGGIGK